MLGTKVKENVKLILIIFGMLALASLSLFMLTKEEDYVSAVDLEGQNNIIAASSYITFDAGFGYSENTTHSAILDVDADGPLLWLKMGVVGGCTIYNPTFQFLTESDNTNINFDIGFGRITLTDSTTHEEFVRSSSKTNNTLCIKDLNGGFTARLLLSPDFERCAQTTQTCKVRFTAQIQEPSGNMVAVSKDIYINVGWTANHSMNLESRATTYRRNARTETLTIETTIQNQILRGSRGFTLPVKQTKIDVIVPTYEGFAPSDVEVKAKKTMATNGKDENNVKFNNDNWTYNPVNRKLTITVDNPDASGNIAFGSGTDEYVITYIYPKGAYDAFDATGRTIINHVDGTMTLYSNTSEVKITKSINSDINLYGEFGIDRSAFTKIGLYMNVLENNPRWGLSIGGIYYLQHENVANTAGSRIEFGELKFYSDSATYSGFNSSTNQNCNPITSISIPEKAFKEYLGEGGRAIIYDDNCQHKIAEITTATAKNAEGCYEVEIPEYYQKSSHNIIVELSEPQANLKAIEINHTRRLAGGTLTLKQAQEVIRASAELKTYYARKDNPTNFELDDKPALIIDEIEFEDTYTDATLNVNTSRLDATNPDFQELKLKIILDNMQVYSDAWDRPYFDIELPEYITDIDRNFNYGITAGNDLEYKEAKIYRVGNKLHFVVVLNGHQNIYSDTTSTSIELIMNVKVDKFVPNCTEDINVNYINQAVKQYKTEGRWIFTEAAFPEVPAGTKAGFTKGTIDFVNTPTLLCISELTGYDGDKTINSIDNKNTAAQISRDKAISPTMTLKIQNNHAVPVSNISVLGRIPYTNNKYVIANADLGTNINTKMSRKLATTSGKNITIYYSDNLDATKDIDLASNNWKTNVDDLSTIRSYMIVINDTLDVGEQINFSYQFDVPAGINYNKSLYASFGAYYDADGTTLTCETDKIGLTTNREGTINVQKTGEILGGGTTAKEGDIIKYTIQVQNNTPEAINNVVIKDTIPENTTYATQNAAGEFVKDPSVREITENLGMIDANAGKVYEFYVIVDEIAENTNIQNTAIVLAEGLDPTPSNTSSIPAEKSEPKEVILEVTKSSSVPTGTTVKEGELVTYKITVKNTGGAVAKNVVIKDNIPENTVYYDKVTNRTNPEIKSVKSDIKETLEPGESFEYTFTVQVGKINEGTTIKNTATASGENVPETKSNTESIKADIVIPNLRVEKTSSIEKGQKVKEGDLITYTITVYNDGDTPAYNVEIHDKVPQYTSYYENDEKDRERVDVGKIIAVLEPGASDKYSFTVMVEEIPKNTTIKNTATAKATNGPTVSSNTIGVDAEISVPDLTLDKTSNIEEGKTIVSGDIIEYTITVTNTGECTAHNVVISDAIPENTVYVNKIGAKYVKDESVREITHTIESLEPGESQTITFNVMVGALNENTQITNTAKVNANNGKETSSNTVGISAKPKETTRGGDLPYTGEYSLIIILIVAIIALSVFAVSEYKRVKRR